MPARRLSRTSSTSSPSPVTAPATSRVTTGDSVVTSPVTIPLSALCGPTNGELCFSDLTSIGGFVTYADTTTGTSTAGLAGTNTTGIAISGGALGWFYSADTLGPGTSCPTPTFGGYLPENPT